MTLRTYATYEEAAHEYMNCCMALRETPPALEVTTRGAGDIPAETLIDRADEIADMSAAMVPLSRPYVESENPVVREGISGQLIVQAMTELQLATELLQIAEEDKGQPALRTRGARGVQLRDAFSMLESTMATPVDQGIPLSPVWTRGGVMPETLEGAMTGLKQSASVATGGISLRVQELGGDIALNLISKTEWSVLAKGATMLSKDVAEKLEAVKEGASRIFAKAVSAAAKTLLNVYNKILALLGKDVEDIARKKIMTWLDEIDKKKNIDLFDSLVGKFYGLDAFKMELAGWLEKTTVGGDEFNQIAKKVEKIGDRFSTLAGRLALLETAVVLAKFIKIPQVLLVIAGIQIALLVVVVYAGFDYIGYKEPRFPNLTKGVGEVIREGLHIVEESE